jgi:hypothetical protein
VPVCHVVSRHLSLAGMPVIPRFRSDFRANWIFRKTMPQFWVDAKTHNIMKVVTVMLLLLATPARQDSCEEASA